jgi:hypothetical protein
LAYRRRVDIPVDRGSVRSFLLEHLFKTSAERARAIRELHAVSPSLADLLIDLEVDDDLRARFEVALLEPRQDTA